MGRNTHKQLPQVDKEILSSLHREFQSCYSAFGAGLCCRQNRFNFDYVGYYKNRFYFNFHVENLDQEMVSQSFDVLFSFDAKKKKLRYEKELTEYLNALEVDR